MSWLTRSLALAGLVTFAALPVHALVVNPTTSATALTDVILGDGVTLVGSPTLVGGAFSAATFTGGGAIGISSGIMLTTGDALLAQGTTNDLDDSTGTFGPGYAPLQALNGNRVTQDATILSFDFTADANALFFNFVFASEEYNEYTNSAYNDVFAFFLDTTNIALIPGTTTPVSIATVNGGNPFGTNATHPEFFNNNDSNDGGASAFPFEYDGFTDVFTASALNLVIGQQYKITLAIADTQDNILDSAVFIQANTFSTTPTPTTVPDAANSLILGLIAFAGLAGFKRFALRRAA